MRLRRLFRLLVPSLGMFRLSVYLFCVSALLGLLAAGAVYANVKDGALALGRQLGGLSNYAHTEEVVLLNGARLHHARTTTSATIAEVLDRGEALCTQNPGLLTQVMDEATKQNRTAVSKHVPKGAWRHAIVRHESDEDGMVLCFAGAPPGGLAELSGALKRFTESADLSEFGHLRYVYVQRRNDGRSHVALYWTNDPLSVTKMFPGAGDAQGTDSLVLPRPPASRRTLSAGVEGRPYAIRVYETAKSTSDIRAFFDNWMKAQGWQTAAISERDATVAYMRKDGYQAFVSLIETGGKMHVALTETGNASGSPIGSVHIGE